MISLKAKTNYSANNIQPIDRKVIPTEFKILFIVLLLLANYVMAPRYSFATNHPKYKSYNQQSSKNKSVKPTNKLNKIKNINTTKKVGPIKHKTHNTTIKKKSKKQKAHKIKPENSDIKPKIFEAKTETAEIKQEMPIDKINNAPKKAIRNNVISEEDIKYYQKEIGDKYKITNTTGRSGYCAIAYELEDKDRNKFVLKIPRDPSNTEYWIKRQKSAEEKIKKYYQNYQRTLKITNYITIGKDFVIEKNWGEQIGKEDFWNSLPKEKTSEFINGMAEFLKFTHSQSVGNVSPIRLDHDQFTFKDAVNYLDEANAINSEEKNMIFNLVEKFRNRDTSDERTCLIHNDIRYQNIVYDPQSKQFALIDFDSLDETGKMYLGFTSKAMAINGIPYEIISKIVDKYNIIANTKINREKIKMILKLGSLFEIVVFGKFKNTQRMETDIFPLYTCVFSEFGENITDETVRKEMWPMIKRKFEEIDKAFS